jgi:short subunit fatty acids transporter
MSGEAKAKLQEPKRRSHNYARAARLLTSASTHNTFALLVALCSATLGVFIPSGGSKWIIEAHRVFLCWLFARHLPFIPPMR